MFEKKIAFCAVYRHVNNLDFSCWEFVMDIAVVGVFVIQRKTHTHSLALTPKAHEFLMRHTYPFVRSKRFWCATRILTSAIIYDAYY